jgi:hypothetical protein
VQGRVEAPARPLAGVQRELDDLEHVVARLDEALLVEPAQLRVVSEAREDLLEPLELGADAGQPG